MTALPVPVAPLALLSPAAARAMDIDPATIISRWLASVSSECRRAYARALGSFTMWAMPGADEPQAGLRLLCEAGAGPAHELLAAWRDHLLERLAPATVAGSLSAIASLLRACRRAGVATFRVEGIAPKRERVQDRSGPRRGDVERLLACVDERAAAGEQQAIRDAAILRCLYNNAMRRGEVTGLRVGDVDLAGPDGARCWPQRKGARTRQALGLSDKTAAAIANWLAVRGPEAGALFHRLDRKGERGHLCGEAIRLLLVAWASQAGLRGTIRPHGLRHSAATELARRGSLDELMALGGWKSLSAASAYLDKRDENRKRALALVDV